MKNSFFTLAIVILWPITLWAHGVSGHVLTTPSPVGLEFLYSTGDIAPYANIEVYSPENKTVEYQNARTDKSGRFAFIPNIPGTWTIIMSDNMGHRAETAISISEEDLQLQKTHLSSQENIEKTCPFMNIPLWLRAIFGISILFNIFIGLYIILFRWKNQHAHK